MTPVSIGRSKYWRAPKRDEHPRSEAKRTMERKTKEKGKKKNSTPEASKQKQGQKKKGSLQTPRDGHTPSTHTQQTP